jgi:hypothetical protein
MSPIQALSVNDLIAKIEDLLKLNKQYRSDVINFEQNHSIMLKKI